MSKPRLPTHTLDHAKRLRKGMTDAERRLWQYCGLDAWRA